MSSERGPSTRVFVHEYVTGGGLAGQPLPPGWEAEGRLMRQALARDFACLPDTNVIVSLDDRFSESGQPWTSVPVAKGQEERVFLEQASRADFTLVIAPETGGCLETRAHWIRDADGTSLGSEPSAIAQTADKLTLARHFVKRDVRTPPTRRFSKLEGLPRDFRYPAVLKPVDGAGSQHTLIMNSCDDEQALARFPDPGGVLQPFLPGTPMSASFLVNEQGHARLLAVATQRIIRADGCLHYEGGEILHDPRRIDGHARRSIESVKGLRGFVGVDYLWNEELGRATVLEINPRPTTSAHAIVRLLEPGRLAREWLKVCFHDSKDLNTLPALVRPLEPFAFGLDDKGGLSNV